MNQSPPKTFWEYRELLRDRMRRTEPDDPASPNRAAETPDSYRFDRGPLPVDERLAQLIWAQQLLQASGLRTAEGVALRVLDPGRWNRSAGPDFRDARLMLGEKTVAGDIEVHLEGADWIRHRHDRDLDYNGVVLHVVLRLGDGKSSDRLHNGSLLPRLELEPYVFPDLETLCHSLTDDDLAYDEPSELGRCHRLLSGMPPAQLADFLDRAGEERLVAKMQRLEEATRNGEDLEQAFFQLAMMTLGSGPSKTLYYLLAKRAPVAELLDFARELPPDQWALGLESLLIHVAGLIPSAEELTEAPSESRARALRLGEIWGRFEPFWSDRVIPPTRRWYQGLRPVNFPVRRLAGMAWLLARALRENKRPLADLLERLEAGRGTLEHAPPLRRKRHPLLAELAGRFQVAGEGRFWGTHYSFTASPAARPMHLIGEGAALSLVLNALAPAALLTARKRQDPHLEAAARALFGMVPPLQPNHLTRFMTRRLFGDRSEPEGLINTERRRQALYQIFHHCCAGQQRNCEACYLLKGKS